MVRAGVEHCEVKVGQIIVDGVDKRGNRKVHSDAPRALAQHRDGEELAGAVIHHADREGQLAHLHPKNGGGVVVRHEAGLLQSLRVADEEEECDAAEHVDSCERRGLGERQRRLWGRSKRRLRLRAVAYGL